MRLAAKFPHFSLMEVEKIDCLRISAGVKPQQTAGGKPDHKKEKQIIMLTDTSTAARDRIKHNCRSKNNRSTAEYDDDIFCREGKAI